MRDDAEDARAPVGRRDAMLPSAMKMMMIYG